MLRNPFQVFMAGSLRGGPAKKWLVHRLVADRESCMIFGPPKVCKTFVAFDLMGCLIRGTEPFAGRFEVPGPVKVVYATCEGKTGVASRIEALDDKYRFTLEEWARFGVVYNVPQLFRSTGEMGVAPFVASVREQFGPDGLSGGILVIDTWARASGGADENTSKDTTEVLNALSQIAQELDCAVLTIHHANKGGDIRGSTNISAGLDTIIHVRRLEDGTLVMGCKISKDSKGVPDVTFSLVETDRKDPSGKPYESSYVSWGDELSAADSKRLATKDQFVRLLRQETDSEERSLTLKDFEERMSPSPDRKTLRAVASEVLESGEYPVAVVQRQITGRDGKLNRKTAHFYWAESTLN